MSRKSLLFLACVLALIVLSTAKSDVIVGDEKNFKVTIVTFAMYN